jgi:hypothetical protein
VHNKSPDLTAGQRAVAAARMLPEYEKLHPEGIPRNAGKNSRVSGRAREDVTRVFKVAARYVQDAKALLAEAAATSPPASGPSWRRGC